jgi:error-prone DNA polymerase
VLLEDEQGTINLVLKPQVYERFRLTVRTEPLVFAEGILECHASAGGTVNLLVDRIEALEPGGAQLAEIGELVNGDFRAVAPAVMSFAQGRRR